jgi:lipopolysaccharide export system protein LptA
MNASETRRRGRKVAALLGAVVLVVLGYSFFNRSKPAGSTPGSQGTGQAGPIAGSGSNDESQTGTQRGSTANSASDVRVEVTDEADGSIVAVLTADKMVPTSETDFAVTEPRVTRFLDDGQTVFARSDTADVHVPRGQERPDQGTMHGNVEVRLFDPPPSGEKVDVTRDHPAMVAELESLRFDSTLGQISTESPIRITGDGYEMQGVGMEWLMNVADSSLNSMRIARGEFARYTPPAPIDPEVDADASPSGQPESPPDAVERPDNAAKPVPVDPTKKPAPTKPKAPAPVKPDAPAPLVRLYRIDFVDQVVLTRGSHEARADRLSLWVRTIDNALPKGAVPQIMDTTRHSALTGVPFGPGLARALAAFVPAVSQPDAAQPADAATPIPAEIRWAGPMIITPIDDVPVQLTGGNHVFLRLSAEETGEVVLTDSVTGSVVRCARVDYAATTQVAVLGHDGDVGEMGVTLLSPSAERGDLRVRLDTTSVDLGAGTFEVRGAGEALNADQEQSLVWSRHASGDLVVQDGKVVGIERALIEGAVRVGSAEGFASGDELDASFDSIDGAVAIRRAVFSGRALAGGSKGETLESDWLEIIFEPGAAIEGEKARPVPNLVTAHGNVVARQPDSITRGESLVAELEPDGKRVVASRVEMVGPVTFEREDEHGTRQTAHAIRLVARPQRKVVNLFGTDEIPAKVTNAGTRIKGKEIHLDGDQRKVEVFGPGRLTNADGDDPDGRRLLDLTWTIDMALDDGGGIIDGRGKVHAVFATDEFSRDTIDAHRLRVLLVPAGAGAKLAGDALSEGQGEWNGMQDRVRRFDAWGSVLFEDDGVDAIIRSRRYGEGGMGGGVVGGVDRGPIVKAMNLSGARIVGERTMGGEATDTLTVPGPGRLLVMDETPENAEDSAVVGTAAVASNERDSPSGGEADSQDMRGAGLFDWDGSMKVDRGTGRFEMIENVRVSHKRSADGSLLYLVADQITGSFLLTTTQDDAGSAEPDMNADNAKKMLGDSGLGDLEKATVSGNVYARWQGRELLADRVIYNAAAGTVRAEADDDSRLTIIESARAAVVHARAATWSMSTGEGKLEGVQPIVVPVGALPEKGGKDNGASDSGGDGQR